MGVHLRDSSSPCVLQVRFCCEECGHGWTSMKGRVAFWFAQAAGTAGAGIVAFRLYGQQCERCKSGRFQDAMWYPEEVVKVRLSFAFHRLLRKRLMTPLTNQNWRPWKGTIVYRNFVWPAGVGESVQSCGSDLLRIFRATYPEGATGW